MSSNSNNSSDRKGVMSKERFNEFMGGDSVSSVMIQTPKPAVVTLSQDEYGTGVKAKAEGAE